MFRIRPFRLPTIPYAGVIEATLLQKSHLAPRFASHVYAFASVKLFIRLGPVRYSEGTVESFGTKVPPVWLRFIWYGAELENTGQLDAAFGEADELDDEPAANAFEMDGSEVVM